MKKVKLGKFIIGSGYPVRIIAEIADNHGGSFVTAKKMVLVAKKAGADIVKFQLHLPDIEMIPDSIQMWDGPLYNILKENLLTIDEHKKLKKFCEENGVMYLCTPYCIEAADLLEKIGVKAYKIGSGEMTNLPMIRHIAKKKKPMIISTGMSSLLEIRETVKVIKKENAPLILMNCTSEYPPNYEDINLNLIRGLEKEFQIPVGHSDHTPDIYTSFAAVACGAKLIEKHFTLDKKQKGPDHFISLEPDELKELAEGTRKIERALGNKKKVHFGERPVREWAFHSVVSAVDIPRGTVITTQALTTKRPGSGIPAKYLDRVIGKKSKKFIKKNNLIKWRDLY